MRLIRFVQKNSNIVKIGALHPDKSNVILDFGAVCPKVRERFTSMLSIIQNFDVVKDKIIKSYTDERFYLDIDTVKILSPLESGDVGRIIGVAANYPPSDPTKVSEPFFFEKSTKSIHNPGENVVLPKNSEQVDIEGELVVVMGKQCDADTFKMNLADPKDFIFGYTICNDLTEKSFIRKNKGHVFFGKNIEHFLPLGPCIAVKDLSAVDYDNVEIVTKLNGQVVQKNTTKNLILNINKIIKIISSYFTLYPGDIILTGTPDLHVECNLQQIKSKTLTCKPGDEICVSIGNLTTLTNKIE